MSLNRFLVVALVAMLFSSAAQADVTRHVYNNSKKAQEIRLSGSGCKGFEGQCAGENCTLQPGQATGVIYQPSGNIFTTSKCTVCFGNPGAANQCYFNQGGPRLHHDGRTPYANLNDPADGDVTIFQAP